jgi:hypothetical protein
MVPIGAINLADADFNGYKICRMHSGYPAIMSINGGLEILFNRAPASS